MISLDALHENLKAQKMKSTTFKISRKLEFHLKN